MPAEAVPDAGDDAMRLVEAFTSACEALPDRTRGLAVVAAVGGMIPAVLAALPDPDARRWAWQQLMHQLVQAGAKNGFVRLGCDDPDCTACRSEAEGAGERRLACH